MRITLLRLVLLPLVAACAVARDDAAAGGAGDTTRPSSAELSAPASASTATPADASASDTLCATVEAVAERTLSVVLARDTGSVFPSPRGGPSWQGCRLRGEGSEPRDSPGPRPTERLVEAMGREGWAEDVTFQADGPDGAATAVRRGAALCHLAQWSAELPTDEDTAEVSTPPTTPFAYVIEILCTPVGPPPLEG